MQLTIPGPSGPLEALLNVPPATAADGSAVPLRAAGGPVVSEREPAD